MWDNNGNPMEGDRDGGDDMANMNIDGVGSITIDDDRIIISMGAAALVSSAITAATTALSL